MKNSFFFENIIYWNHRFHIYIGLFLILFILLFSFSGLLLNHGQWEFASFWKERKEVEIVTTLTIPANPDSTALLHNLMEQLNLSGEIINVKRFPSGINFRVMKPGTIHDIQVDLTNGKCVRKELVYNWYGKIRTLHTFNGSNKMKPEVKPNWLLTKTWSSTMDAVAIGLIFLCISSWIMWFKIRRKYTYGWIILFIGFGTAVFFIFLLKMY